MTARLHIKRQQPKSKQRPKHDYSSDAWLRLLMEGQYCRDTPAGISGQDLWCGRTSTALADPDAGFDALNTEQLQSVLMFDKYRHQYIDSAHVWQIDVVKEAYQEQLPELLSIWCNSYPATRPEPWWMWTAQEPRRLISGYPIHKRQGAGIQTAGGGGIPPCWIEYGDQAAEFETEQHYLQRLGLLFPDELKLRRYLEFHEPRGSYIKSGAYLPHTVK